MSLEVRTFAFVSSPGTWDKNGLHCWHPGPVGLQWASVSPSPSGTQGMPQHAGLGGRNNSNHCFHQSQLISPKKGAPLTPSGTAGGPETPLLGSAHPIHTVLRACGGGTALLTHPLGLPRASTFLISLQFPTCDRAVLASCPGTCRAHRLSQVSLHLPASFLGSGGGGLPRLPFQPGPSPCSSPWPDLGPSHMGDQGPQAVTDTHAPTQPGPLDSIQ